MLQTRECSMFSLTRILCVFFQRERFEGTIEKAQARGAST